jgi:hypothetical protein
MLSRLAASKPAKQRRRWGRATGFLIVVCIIIKVVTGTTLAKSKSSGLVTVELPTGSELTSKNSSSPEKASHHADSSP